ncbi:MULTISPECIES: TetR/AcrR family transcriptional regulator [unclassified Pseudomonas]|uniref:TetR/AcrR family transcriptional regulator n=1 Tax=unclassified Pseudomonas TaxID=196821 RepID=UPI001F2C0A9B|nr:MULTISPECIES: TetR/AcrR family transcriptional regulator [unclassified Pseudomonas]MCF5233325.1 TetR family transcriptional regulator [Pseudomonas sp. PA-5-4H]MCF5238735.1 TetR family transcriptional regulator [Pseudomonas sp. PA-5-4G]MCF5250301.1 TetR family transcriptional regulator [Pseudomonas sp. PA-5-4B]MCF5256979.1 TetR family transcriptional regulator [Pseudomonas sp. PA-5-4B]MCF5262532.1 TetR family transcriptional regulator [Pseudomonas sp. PA-5-4A]
MNNETKSTRQAILDTAQVIVGRKGFSAVGLNEILQAAEVPKGSFYHYFNSKDAFGVVLLDSYFDHYVNGMQQLFDQPEVSGFAKLMRYWHSWVDNQTGCTDTGKCLAVKLGAEVSDLSEPMRLALQRGTARTIELLAQALQHGIEDGSLQAQPHAESLARRLYALWLGTSVMSKITRTSAPFDEALLLTQHLLQPIDRGTGK